MFKGQAVAMKASRDMAMFYDDRTVLELENLPQSMSLFKPG
jgi:hypothetical protein